VLKEKVERKKRELETNHTHNLEQHLTQVQDRCPYYNPAKHVQENFTPLIGAVKPTQIEIPPYSADILRWKEFWDMFEVPFTRRKGKPILINSLIL